MNERIKQLALQASITFTDYGSGEFLTEDDISLPRLEKFAELIVRECVSVTDDLVNRNVDGSWTSNELYTDYNGALFEVKRRIQEHFGVEE
jgi:hypothetical protein